MLGCDEYLHAPGRLGVLLVGLRIHLIDVLVLQPLRRWYGMGLVFGEKIPTPAKHDAGPVVEHGVELRSVEPTVVFIQFRSDLKSGRHLDGHLVASTEPQR